MDNDKLKDEINKRKKEEWIEAWLSIEALAVSKETVESSVKSLIENLSRFPGVFVYEHKVHEAVLVKNPMKGVEEAYSQIADVKLFAKDLITMLNISAVYGPSAVEIIGPKKKTVEMGEIQNTCNALAALVHHFAAAGVGGIVIAPQKKEPHNEGY
ncbi:MAG: hypothetical protein HY513_04380 [Candidatus Aenigmarchaeota archaeon]|nr:hypothetical protein [Candidatus Aenigmarchaeota archaeon]